MTLSPEGYERIYPLSPIEKDLYYRLMKDPVTEIHADHYLLVVEDLATALPVAGKLLVSDLVASISLGSLSDVTIEEDLDIGHTIGWDGEKWVNAPVDAVTLQGEAISTDAPAEGQALTYSEDPGEWVPGNPVPAAHTHVGADITDFSTVLSEELFDDRWEDLRIAATSTNIGTANAPAFAKLLDDGAGSQGCYTYLFDAAAEEELFFAVQLPHSWLEGSDIFAHVHWVPTTANAGNVVWGLEYSWANIEGVYANSVLTTVTDSTDSTAKKHIMSNFPVIAGAGKTASSMILCRVYRKAADAADTYANDAALLEIDFHYRVSRVGEVYIPNP